MPQSEWEPSDDVISAANKAWWGERGGSDVERMRAALKAVREDMVREEREACLTESEQAATLAMMTMRKCPPTSVAFQRWKARADALWALTIAIRARSA